MESGILKIVFFFKSNLIIEQCCQTLLLKLLLIVTLVSTIITGIRLAKLYISTILQSTTSHKQPINRLTVQCFSGKPTTLLLALIFDN